MFYQMTAVWRQRVLSFITWRACLLEHTYLNSHSELGELRWEEAFHYHANTTNTCSIQYNVRAQRQTYGGNTTFSINIHRCKTDPPVDKHTILKNNLRLSTAQSILFLRVFIGAFCSLVQNNFNSHLMFILECLF